MKNVRELNIGNGLFFSGVNVEIKIVERLHEAAIHIGFLRRCLFDTSKKVADANVCSMYWLTFKK